MRQEGGKKRDEVGDLKPEVKSEEVLTTSFSFSSHVSAFSFQVSSLPPSGLKSPLFPWTIEKKR